MLVDKEENSSIMIDIAIPIDVKLHDKKTEKIRKTSKIEEVDWQDLGNVKGFGDPYCNCCSFVSG